MTSGADEYEQGVIFLLIWKHGGAGREGNSWPDVLMCSHVTCWGMKQSLRSDEVYGPRTPAFTVWRGGIALIHPDSWNDVYFLKGKSRWQRGASLASLGMRESCWSYRRLHSKTQGWWHINQQRRKSQDPSMSPLPLAKVSEALLHPCPSGNSLPPALSKDAWRSAPSCFHLCSGQSQALCQSSPGAPQSCWPGPPQPKAPSGLGPGPPVSSP